MSWDRKKFGPTTKVEVSCSYLDEDSLQLVMGILLVGASSDDLPGLGPLSTAEELEQLFLFDGSEPTVVPDPDELINQAQQWARGEEENMPERLQFYWRHLRSHPERLRGAEVPELVLEEKAQ